MIRAKFEWNGFQVQVLEDSIEIKPKTHADSPTSLPEYLPNPAPDLENQVYIWPQGRFLQEFLTTNRLWVQRVEMNPDGTISGVVCGGTNSEHIDSKMIKSTTVDPENQQK